MRGNSGRLTTIHSASASRRSGERQRRRSRKLSAPVRTKRAADGRREGGQGIDGVVRATVRARGIEGGDEEVAGCGVRGVCFRRKRKASHCQAVGVAGDDCSGLEGLVSTGAKRTRSSVKTSAAAEARRRCPRWMGSNVPPKKATRILPC